MSYLNQHLRDAAKVGDLEKVTWSLDQGARIDEPDDVVTYPHEELLIPLHELICLLIISPEIFPPFRLRFMKRYTCIKIIFLLFVNNKSIYKRVIIYLYVAIEFFIKYFIIFYCLYK